MWLLSSARRFSVFSSPAPPGPAPSLHPPSIPPPSSPPSIRFLSTGNSYKDCGHPCEAATLHLRDPQGADHLVLADMGCRNTVFNARAQSGEEGEGEEGGGGFTFMASGGGSHPWDGVYQI